VEARERQNRQNGYVIEDAGALVASFREVAVRAGLTAVAPILRHELTPAPHLPPRALPSAAVYVFTLSAEYGRTCPAGANRTLKVGKVGPNSAARFCSQHYLPNSTGSNLAKSLVTERVLWSFLGIDHLDESGVRSWMLANLDRDHVFVAPENRGLERELERFLRGHLGPVFEG
jgi:hypothetical protein